MKALTSNSGLAAGGSSAGATIYQVARQAGVSIATVSRVLRGTAPVSDAKRRQVLDAVEMLGFTPSRPARSLAEGRHAAYGIVFPDLSGPYFAEVVLGYEELAADHGCSVLILSTHGREAARELVLDLASRVDGVVVLGRTVDDQVIADLVGKAMPVVTVARSPLEGADGVNAENAASARQLTEHLVLEHGYRDIAFLGDADSSFDTCERWQTFSATMTSLGAASPTRPVPCAFNENAGHAAALRTLQGRRRPRALMCANDEIALGAVLAAEELALAVPDDVAVTGWDDVMAARHSRPGLTTVRQPMRELGAWAARRLHARLTGEVRTPQHQSLGTSVVIRPSCGPHDVPAHSPAIESPTDTSPDATSPTTTSPTARSRTTRSRSSR